MIDPLNHTPHIVFRQVRVLLTAHFKRSIFYQANRKNIYFINLFAVYAFVKNYQKKIDRLIYIIKSLFIDFLLYLMFSKFHNDILFDS